MSKQTLLDIQRSAGAVFAEMEMDRPFVLHFGKPHAEFQSARNTAAVFDLSDRTQIEMTGNDRCSFLHNFCTNDIKSLQPGQGCQAFVTNVKGRVLSHIFVFAELDSLWLETVAETEEAILAHLNRYIISEDVQLHGRSSDFGELFMTGPETLARLGRLNLAVEELDLYGHTTWSLGDVSISVRRTDFLGTLGFLLSVPAAELVNLWDLLIDMHVSPAGAEAFHALRIEAGTPLYGRDISDTNLAQEVAHTKQAISFAKGCYLGQEPIARIDALGHVNQELRGLRLQSGPVPKPGSLVVTGQDEKEVGMITSSALSYDDGKPVALAYLRRGFVTPGTVVSVKSSDLSVAATVFWPH